MALLHRVASGSITPPSDGPLTPVLLAMLAAAPEDRPAMQEVSDVLAEVAAGRAARGATGRLARRRPGPHPRPSCRGSRPRGRGRGSRNRRGQRGGSSPRPGTATTSRLARHGAAGGRRGRRPG